MPAPANKFPHFVLHVWDKKNEQSIWYERFATKDAALREARFATRALRTNPDVQVMAFERELVESTRGEVIPCNTHFYIAEPYNNTEMLNGRSKPIGDE